MKPTDINLGIVIRAERVKEADIRVRLLTADGIKMVTAAGAAKQGAKLASAVQPFTIAEFNITGAKLTGARVLQSGIGVTKEINRYYLACAICEILINTTDTKQSKTESTQQIFYLTARSLEALSITQISAYKIFINFFTKLLVLLGYDIDSDFEKIDMIETFKETTDEDIDMIKLSLDTAKQCIRQINKSYEEHLDMRISCANNFL